MSGGATGDRPGGGYVGRPSHGLRLEVVRDDDDGSAARVVYRGHVHRMDASIALEVVATAASAEVTLEAGARLDDADRQSLVKQISALVRAATRTELATGAAVPKKIVRWRAGSAGSEP